MSKTFLLKEKNRRRKRRRKILGRAICQRRTRRRSRPSTFYRYIIMPPTAPVFQLGALARLFPTVAATTAKWAGRGFNLIEIPDHTGQLNRPPLPSRSEGARLLTHMSTNEVWTFEKAGVVPNRTFRPPAPAGGQPDQFTSAISYSQHVTAKSGTLDQQPVTDPTMIGTIHGEKGFFDLQPDAHHLRRPCWLQAV